MDKVVQNLLAAGPGADLDSSLRELEEVATLHFVLVDLMQAVGAVNAREKTAFPQGAAVVECATRLHLVVNQCHVLIDAIKLQLELVELLLQGFLFL